MEQNWMTERECEACQGYGTHEACNCPGYGSNCGPRCRKEVCEECYGRGFVEVEAEQ